MPWSSKMYLCFSALLCGANPLVWANDLCAHGRQQSPIDIGQATRPVATGLTTRYGPLPARIVNDGHTVRVRFEPGGSLLLGRERYALRQFHFHTPGGDRLQGEEFAMAMHFLHRSPSGRLMSLVQLFRLGAENPALAALWPEMPARGQAEQAMAQRLNADAFLSESRAYYRYEGSLTAAPCTEGVLWLVMKQPQTLSAAQLAGLGRLFGPNARPVQPLNGRVVSEGGMR